VELLRSELDKSVDIVMNNTREVPLVASGGGGVGDGNDATANRDVMPAAAETIVGEAEVTTRQGRGILWLLVLLITMVLAVVAASTVKRLKQAQTRRR